MDTIEKRINELVTHFINDITMLARDMAMETLTAALGGEPSSASSRSPGAKRSREELTQLADRLLAFVTENPGLRIEQINEKLGTKTKDIFRPLKHLIRGKQVRREGDRRASRYFPAAVKVADGLTKPRAASAIAEHGSIRAAARALGIPNSTFQGLCKRWGLTS
jgi:hypothetical protein